jgi:hypothetical protein
VQGTPSFSDETRLEAERFASDPKIFELGVAHVILIPGLGGTAVKAFINTILLVARPPAPAKAFDNLPAAVDWMLPKLQGYTKNELLLACDELRARVRALESNKPNKPSARPS